MITTMSNKDSSARMTGTFIIFILNLFLVVIREKRDLSQPSDSYIILIMNSQSRTRSRRAGPSQPGPARPCQGLKVDMRIALRRRGGPSVLAGLVVLTLYMPCSCISVDCSNNMYDLSINKLYILLGNLYICPHNRKVFVRMVILFYPATSARVHFTKCDHCATAASFRRWLAPVVGAFLTVAYRWSSWDRFS